MNPGNGNGLIYVGIPRERMYIPAFVDNRDKILSTIVKAGLECGYYQAEGHRVDRNRDKIVSEFLKHPKEPEWLLMLDTDMEHPHDLALRLVKWKKPIVGGLYFRRGDAFEPFVFKNAHPIKDQYGRTHRSWTPMRDLVYDYLEKNQVPLKDGAVVIEDDGDEPLVECDAIATGAMLLHRTVLEAMKPGPWFEYESGGISEDLMFCAHAKEDHGFPIFCDISTISGHYSWVPMGQAQFRMNYLNRGINITSYSKRQAAEMWAEFNGVTEDEGVKAIEAGSASEVSKLWRIKPDDVSESDFYQSEEVGKAYLMELLHWNYTRPFTQLRQNLTHIRKQNVIEIGSGIGTVALQLIIQGNNVLGVEPNKILRDFIDMRYKVAQENVTTGIGMLSVVDNAWMDNCESESFNIAVAFDVLEHIPEDELWRVMKHLGRVLTTGGHLIYHANWYQQDLYPMHHNYEKIWPEILADAGFTQITPMDAVRMR